MGGSLTLCIGGLTALSFIVGALTSILAGFIGMMVAVYSNARTTGAEHDLKLVYMLTM